jgi:chromosome segregation ATPase
MDKVTIYRVLWSTLKLDATNRHGLADVITLEDHRRALDAERERLKGQIDYSIQLQQLIESLRRDDTPSPELYHHKIIVEFKRQLATLQAQVKQLDRTLADVYQQRDGLQAQLRQVKGELANEKAAYEKLSEQWNKDSLDLQAKDAEIAAWKLELGRMRANHPEKGCYAALPKLRSQVGTLTNANARLRAALECMLYAQSPAWGYQGTSNRAGAVQAAQQAIADTDQYSQARLKCGHASGQIARHCLVCGEVDQ